MLDNGKARRNRCHTCANKGMRSPQWKGGRSTTSYGYIIVWLSPSDFFYPMASKRGYVLEHRLIVAKALGRCLWPWELVHHKGAKYPHGSIENKQDNRYPENLQLVMEGQHKQITALEKEIEQLQKRVVILEAEIVLLRQVDGSRV